MTFTISTIPMLLLIAGLYFAAGRKFGPVMMFVTIFQGAAIVILGGGGAGLALAPAQIALVLWIVEKVFSTPAPGAKHSQAQINVFVCLLLYAGYAILTAIFSPFFFDGIAVSNPRVGLGAPLTWSMYNVTQGSYLLLGVTVFWLCAFRSTEDEVRRSLDWYVGGSTLAAGIAVYQYVAFNHGLPFPSELLHSNTQYSIFEAYDLGGFTRVNSTFTEAAAAAGCFSTAFALVLWRVLFVEFTKPLFFSLVTLATGLILTRSTTGYVALSFIVMIAAALYLRKVSVPRPVQVFRDAFAITILVGAVVLFMIPDVREGISALLDQVLFTKTKTASYEERTAWNEAALSAGAATHWIGAGWGSLRASSLGANLLGTVGIPGVILFGAFVFLSGRLAIQMPPGRSQTQRSVLLAIAVGLVDYLLSGPEMTDPATWFLFGVAACVPFKVLRNASPPRFVSAKHDNRSVFRTPDPLQATQNSPMDLLRGDIV